MDFLFCDKAKSAGIMEIYCEHFFNEEITGQKNFFTGRLIFISARQSLFFLKSSIYILHFLNLVI